MTQTASGVHELHPKNSVGIFRTRESIPHKNPQQKQTLQVLTKKIFQKKDQGIPKKSKNRGHFRWIFARDRFVDIGHFAHQNQRNSWIGPKIWSKFDWSPGVFVVREMPETSEKKLGSSDTYF